MSDDDDDADFEGGGVRPTSSTSFTSADLLVSDIRKQIIKNLDKIEAAGVPRVNEHQICVPLDHPLHQSRVKALGDLCQTHDCSRGNGTCYKMSKTRKYKLLKRMSAKKKEELGDRQPCRFGFPRETHVKTEVKFDDSDPSRPSLEVQYKQDDPYYNTCNLFLLSTWAANTDLRIIGNHYAAIKYVASYVTKTDEADDKGMTNAVLTKFAEYKKKGKTTLKDDLTATAMGVLSYDEVCLEMALWILMSYPLTTKSHAVVSVSVARPDRPLLYAAVRPADMLRECDDDDSLVSTGIGSQAGRVINYEKRPRAQLLEHAQYICFGIIRTCLSWHRHDVSMEHLSLV